MVEAAERNRAEAAAIWAAKEEERKLRMAERAIAHAKGERYNKKIPGGSRQPGSRGSSRKVAGRKVAAAATVGRAGGKRSGGGGGGGGAGGSGGEGAGGGEVDSGYDIMLDADLAAEGVDMHPHRFDEGKQFAGDKHGVLFETKEVEDARRRERERAFVESQANSGAARRKRGGGDGGGGGGGVGGGGGGSGGAKKRGAGREAKNAEREQEKGLGEEVTWEQLRMQPRPESRNANRPNPPPF